MWLLNHNINFTSLGTTTMSTLIKTDKTFSVTCECIKHNDSLNLTWGMNKYLSITGTAVIAENFIQDGEDLSPYLLKCRSVLCFTEEMGNAVLDTAAKLFAKRAEEGSLNPVVAIRVEAQQLGQVANGHLILDITNAVIIDVEFPAFNGDVFKKRALDIQVKTEEANFAALEETQSKKPVLKARTVEIVSQTSTATASQRIVPKQVKV